MAPGLRLSYWNPRLLRTMYFQLQQQQQGGLFCDVTLQGNGEGLHVHSCVIAACSPYIAKLLTCPGEISGGFDPSKPILFNRRVLHFREISSHHLLPLVRYMYTSELEIAPADVHGVLKAAKKLQIPELEILQLQGGRLVRPECGRRLNRNCLSSMKHTQYEVADIQNNGLRPVVKDMHAKDNKKSSSNMLKMEPRSPEKEEVTPSCLGAQEVAPSCLGAQEVAPSCLGAQEVAPSCLGAQEVAPSCLGAQEVAPSCLGAQEVAPSCLRAQEAVPNCLESMMKKVPISQGIAEKTKSLPSSFHYHNRPVTVSEKQNRGSPKILPDQDKELIAVEKQTAYDITSRKRLTKRLRLDRGRKQAVLPKPKKDRVIDSKNINMTSHDVQNDLQFQEASRGHQLPDKSASEEHAGNLEGSVDCRLRPEKIKTFHLKEGTDTAQCVNSEMADPTEHTATVSFNDCIGLEGISKEWSDQMTEVENETVNQRSLLTVDQCKSDTGMVYPHDKAINCTDTAQCISCEMADPTEDTVSFNDCVGLESISKDWSDQMTEVENETVNQRSLGTIDQCKSDAGMVYPHKDMNEPGKRCLSVNESHASEIEKVKLRKASNGRSWEVVREVESPHIECYDGSDKPFNELEQLLEEILNVPSPMSPGVDVGGCSPVTVVEGVWPDLSSDSDTDVDVLG